MEDEHDVTIQKKLSFSIDTILDKPQPLFLKIKHHHHHLLLNADPHPNRHSDSLAYAEHLALNQHKDNDAASDCSGNSCSDADEDDDDGSCSEENETNGMPSYHHHHEITHRKKKTRTVFSRTQIFQLETTFDRKRYLSSADRANLAQGLRLTEQQVKVRECISVEDTSSVFRHCLDLVPESTKQVRLSILRSLLLLTNSFLSFRLKRQIVEASQSINSVVASMQVPSSSSPSSSNTALLKHSLQLPSDFSSSASSSISPLSGSSKPHHRFDATSFYELATLAAAHAAAAAFHTSKGPNSNTTYQDFANALSMQTAVWLHFFRVCVSCSFLSMSICVSVCWTKRAFSK